LNQAVCKLIKQQAALKLTGIDGLARVISIAQTTKKNWVQLRTPHERTIGSLASAGGGFNPEDVLY
jgi:hypothetical protein